MMTILVDMDDTIEQLLKAWVQGVNEKYGRSVQYEDIASWDVSAAFPGLTWEQVYAVPMEPGFWKTVEPVPGAAEALQKFMAAGHSVYIVTATPHESVPEKNERSAVPLFSIPDMEPGDYHGEQADDPWRRSDR